MGVNFNGMIALSLLLQFFRVAFWQGDIFIPVLIFFGGLFGVFQKT